MRFSSQAPISESIGLCLPRQTVKHTSRVSLPAWQKILARPGGAGTGQGALLGVRDYGGFCLVHLSNSDNLPGHGIKKNRVFALVAEIKHVLEGTCDHIERPIRDSRQAPVVFDKSDNRTKIGKAMIHEVSSRVRRNHQRRNSGTISAA